MSRNNSLRILVGLSGGVDSAVSALLLQQQGHEVAGGFMINYLEADNEACTTKKDLEIASEVAKFLHIPFFTFDYQEAYEERIVSYIYKEYERGNTPNPDVFCNNLIKFDLFLAEAIESGYDAIATGHYARLSGKNLFTGKDPKKDQSYFLARTTDFQRLHALFPLGELLKSEVRAIAEKYHLPNAKRKDSQGLCFIGKVSMQEFLARRLPKNPGNIVDTSGKVIGTHQGIHAYTIGQRKGICVGGGPALFVLQKQKETNILVVGNAQELSLFSSSCFVGDWQGDALKENTVYHAKIRYGQAFQSCTITPKDHNTYKIHFVAPQRAIAPGQICVLYDGERVVGSGIILQKS